MIQYGSVFGRIMFCARAATYRQGSFLFNHNSCLRFPALLPPGLIYLRLGMSFYSCLSAHWAIVDLVGCGSRWGLFVKEGASITTASCDYFVF